jgi:hypothetical protein
MRASAWQRLVGFVTRIRAGEDVRIGFACVWLSAFPACCLGQGDTALFKANGGRFQWELSPALLAPVNRPEDPCYSVKDPSIVYFENRWHLFCTIRSAKRSHQIEYLSFSDWRNANTAERHVLTITNGYFCAPQVFYFEPHRKWYLIYQALDPRRKVALQPAFSTSANLADPNSWAPPVFLYSTHPSNVEGWIDFWVICDETKAYLFFTSNNGKMWRAQASLAGFPFGWSPPEVVLQADIFEASHTYRLKGRSSYLTIVESVGPGGRRYYKAYEAQRLDGEWTPLADTLAKPFAGPVNVHSGRDTEPWTDSFSHGELIRAGYDQHLEVDPDHLEFLFQGVSDRDRAGKPYGEIPWRLGLLKALP